MKIALQDPYKNFFGTLANQIRIDIIKLLRKSEADVSYIVSNTNYTQPTISHSLQRLLECGFVNVKQDGKRRIYSLNKTTIKPLFDIMESHMNSFCRHRRR